MGVPKKNLDAEGAVARIKQNAGGCSLRERKTGFVDIFRSTPAKTVCPNFYVLAHASGCAFSPRCSYCYLKSSFWFMKESEAFTNVEKMAREIRNWIARDDLESYVLNTGNLSDSLSFEEARPLILRLTELFREEAEKKGRKHALLLVTKGGMRQCEPLLETESCRNVILSFSVNNANAARKHEKGAPSVHDRMGAARRLKEKGWRIRIRIDPMIKGFDYGEIAGRVGRLAPELVTLGCLRAESNLPRFAGKDLFAELETPSDNGGMARYPAKQRLALYRQAAEILRGACPVGLCEETADIWEALRLDAGNCNCVA